VRTAARNQGIGGKVLAALMEHATRPTLVGTWAAAEWAIRFYQRHGFRLVTPEEKDRLLREYWSIPDRQIERFAHDGIYSSALMRPKHIKKYCKLDDAGESLLGEAVRRLGLSARAYHRILKVARTIADLDHQDNIAPHHLLEAIQYRSLDRALF